MEVPLALPVGEWEESPHLPPSIQAGLLSSVCMEGFYQGFFEIKTPLNSYYKIFCSSRSSRGTHNAAVNHKKVMMLFPVTERLKKSAWYMVKDEEP